MPGFNRDTTGVTDQNVLYADNVDFSGSTAPTPTVTTNGQLLIGSTATPNIKVGTLTSPSGTITIGYSSPNITLDLTGGTTAIDSIGVDTTTGAGTNPVLPDAAGLVTFTGGQYPTGTFGTRVITINSQSPNNLQVLAQISSAVAAADSTKNGISHFDSARFTVAATGFVSINGSGVGETITGDTGGALSPTAGNWNILGATGGVNWRTSGSGSTLTGRSDILNRTVPGAYPYTALSTDYIIEVDTSAARTINLPNAPTTGKSYVIKDVTGSAATNNITLTTVGGAVTIDGSTSRTLSSNYVSTSVYFNGTSYFII